MQTRIRCYKSMMAAIIAVFWLSGCEEAKRYEISGNDRTPPGQPVFIDSKPLSGGARVFFRAPADEDVLSIEVAYLNAADEQVRFAASYFTDSLDVYGFGREGEHTIELYAVDRAGNRSASVVETVTSLEPPVVSVANTIVPIPSFASFLLSWSNRFQEPLYVSVDYSYTQNGVYHEYSRVFASHQWSERISIDSVNLYAGEPVSLKMSVSDKFGNVSAAKDATIVLLTDEAIPKDGWGLPAQGSVKGGVAQVVGRNLEMAVDGLIELTVPENFFITTEDNPWNIIIDLGENYELSRIVTHQRRSGLASFSSIRGTLYRGDNVLNYNLYGWNESLGYWESFSSRFEISEPVVREESEFVTMGLAGDQFFIYSDVPRFSKPTRYVRFEALNGKYISEITLYGRKAI